MPPPAQEPESETLGLGPAVCVLRSSQLTLMHAQVWEPRGKTLPMSHYLGIYSEISNLLLQNKFGACPDDWSRYWGELTAISQVREGREGC